MKIRETSKLLVTFLIVVLVSLLSLNLNAQNYARIKILSGGAPTFIFNSLRKYSEGVTLENWTKLRLELNETEPGYNKWQLSVTALTPVIQSDGTATLDLSSLYIKVVSYDLISGTTIDYTTPEVMLSSGSAIILGGTGVTSVVVDVSLSYDCGTKGINKLMNAVPDYYTVDLLFRLYSVP